MIDRSKRFHTLEGLLLLARCVNHKRHTRRMEKLECHIWKWISNFWPEDIVDDGCLPGLHRRDPGYIGN